MNDERIETLILAVMINNLEEACFTQLMKIATSIKLLKIVTNKPSNFMYIERRLYEEYGIAIQVTNNKEKSLVGSDLIINFDFNEYEIMEYELAGNQTIVNIKNKVEVDSPKFTREYF